MIKKILFIWFSSMFFTTIGFSSVLKGSDYVSTKVGTIYNYEKETDSGRKSVIQHIVQDCDDNSKEMTCTYTSQTKSSSNDESVPHIEYEYIYHIEKDGAVYILNEYSGNDELLFPAELKVGQLETYTSETIDDAKIKGSYKLIKEVPEVTIKGHKYKNCVEYEQHSRIFFKSSTIDIKLKETYCKNIGLVKANTVQVDKKLKTGEKIKSESNIYLSSIDSP